MTAPYQTEVSFENPLTTVKREPQLQLNEDHLQEGSLLSLIPLTKLKGKLDGIFQSSEWIDFEIETLSLTLGIAFNALLVDKITVLQIILSNPELFFEDIGFTLYASKVMNNEVADFGQIPYVNTLELAWAIRQVSQLLLMIDHDELDEDVITAFEDFEAYQLRQEGYSVSVAPFNVSPGKLEPGQTEEDIRRKELAIERYINYMESL
jgi:hypothetical protein